MTPLCFIDFLIMFLRLLKKKLLKTARNFSTFILNSFSGSPNSFTSKPSVFETFCLFCNQLSFQAFWSFAFFCSAHLIVLIFCHNCMGKIGPLIRLHADSLSGKECRKVPYMLSAQRGGNKGACPPVEDKQCFQRYDIYQPGAGYELFCHLNGAYGTVGADRHVLHRVNCLAAGVPRSAVLPPPHPRALYSLQSHLLAVICKQRLSAGRWVELSRTLCSPSGLFHVWFNTAAVSTLSSTTAQATREDVQPPFQLILLQTNRLFTFQLS